MLQHLYVAAVGRTETCYPARFYVQYKTGTKIPAAPCTLHTLSMLQLCRYYASAMP